MDVITQVEPWIEIGSVTSYAKSQGSAKYGVVFFDTETAIYHSRLHLQVHSESAHTCLFGKIKKGDRIEADRRMCRSFSRAVV